MLQSVGERSRDRVVVTQFEMAEAFRENEARHQREKDVASAARQEGVEELEANMLAKAKQVYPSLDQNSSS